MKVLKTVFHCFEEKAKSSQVKAAVLAAGTASAMAPVAFASEGSGTGTGMSSILGSIDTVVSLMGKVWDVMTSNPLLTLFLAVSLLMVGIKVFRRIKAAAK